MTHFRTIPHHLPWVLGIAVVMAVTGPFGSYETMGLGKRLLYFAIIGVLSWALVIGCVAHCARSKRTTAGRSSFAWRWPESWRRCR